MDELSANREGDDKGFSLSALRSICDQFSAEYRANAATTVQQETRRTNNITYLDYLDTVEVIGSIPVAPIVQLVALRCVALERYLPEILNQIADSTTSTDTSSKVRSILIETAPEI